MRSAPANHARHGSDPLVHSMGRVAVLLVSHARHAGASVSEMFEGNDGSQYASRKERDMADAFERWKNYGRYQWTIDLASGEWLSVMAESAKVLADGTLQFFQKFRRQGVADDHQPPEEIIGAFAPGVWRSYWQLSAMGGDRMCVTADSTWWKKKTPEPVPPIRDAPMLADIMKMKVDPPREKGPNFRKWLSKLVGRDDPIGDFAGDAMRDPHWKGDDVRSLSDAMASSPHTCEEALNAFTGAQMEFKEYCAELEARAYERAKLSPSLRFKILKRDNFTCRCCGATKNDEGVRLHVDHIIALKNGGKTEEANLQTLCSTCNFGKGTD